jgi:hypothetical protein
VPADVRAGPPPAELEALLHGASDAFAEARSAQWTAAAATVAGMERARPAVETPQRLGHQLSEALARLRTAVAARDKAAAATASVGVGQAALDLELRHRPRA